MQCKLEKNGKIGRPQRGFDEWAADPGVLIYYHTFHAVCSLVGFRQLREAG